MSPLTMEALQMLKFHLKKEYLTFTEGWVTPEEQMTDNDLASFSSPNHHHQMLELQYCQIPLQILSVLKK